MSKQDKSNHSYKKKMKRRKSIKSERSITGDHNESSSNSSMNSGVAYAMFSLQNQEAIRNQLPADASVDMIAQSIEHRWRNLTQEERLRWEYSPPASTINNSDELKPPSPSKQKPKRPLSAYFYFAKEMRPKIKLQYPNLGGNDVTKEIGIMWSRLDLTQKQPYVYLEQEAKDEYDKAMEEWKESLLGNNMDSTESSFENGNNEEANDDSKLPAKFVAPK